MNNSQGHNLFAFQMGNKRTGLPKTSQDFVENDNVVKEKPFTCDGEGLEI